MKTLSQLRDELAEWAQGPTAMIRRDQNAQINFKAGFDAGAQAVMVRAQRLADTLDLCRDEILGCAGHKSTRAVDTAFNELSRWQAFVKGGE